MSEKLFKTSINLSETTRKEMISLLNRELADLFDLYSQVKQAHWNVKGPNFIFLHKFFDELASELEEFVDLLAERVTAFGGLAKGTARMAASASRLPELPLELTAGTELLKALAERYAAVSSSIREAIDLADKAGDQGTADLFTEVSRSLDKSLWFIEAHLQQ